MGKKDPPPFHNPFTSVKGKLAALVKKPAPPTRASAKPAAPAAAPKPPPTDERLFEDEMLGVARFDPDPRGRIRATKAKRGQALAEPKPTAASSRRAIDEAETYAELADLVEGSGNFDISDSDEFIEGLAPGLDRRILKRLRKGEYALKGHVDLHGMTQNEARAAVERFVIESRAQGRRGVLIIHGRGLNSKDQIPVLKERVKAWLERGRIAKSVLAFCTARPCDGGAGAVYVLLRK